MAARLSRRTISRFVAKQLLAGDDQVLSQLAALLFAERRTDELDLLVRDIEAALASAGVVVSDVVTAEPLSAELKKSVEKFIKDATKAKTVTFRERVDATELGGIKINLPGAEYDATLRGRLAALQSMKV